MPSKSAAQHRLMAAAAHTKGGFGGVPQKVGKEFAKADEGKKFKDGGVTKSLKSAGFYARMSGVVAHAKGDAPRAKASLRRWKCP